MAYAIAGNVMTDLMTQPVGKGKGGKDIYLGDIWPTSDEVYKLMKFAMDAKAFKANYGNVTKNPGKLGKPSTASRVRSTPGPRAPTLRSRPSSTASRWSPRLRSPA